MAIGARYTDDGELKVADEDNPDAWIVSDLTAENLIGSYEEGTSDHGR